MSTKTELLEVSAEEAKSILDGLSLSEKELYKRYDGEHDGGVDLHSWQWKIIHRMIHQLKDDEEALVSLNQMINYVRMKAQVASFG